jgi:hypothetical protein
MLLGPKKYRTKFSQIGQEFISQLSIFLSIGPPGRSPENSHFIVGVLLELWKCSVRDPVIQRYAPNTRVPDLSEIRGICWLFALFCNFQGSNMALYLWNCEKNQGKNLRRKFFHWKTTFGPLSEPLFLLTFLVVLTIIMR